MTRPLDPLPSQHPASLTPGAPGSPSADRIPSPPVTAGRRPAGPAANQPLQASFRFEELARQVVVALIEPETHEVVRQIPPERILKLIIDLTQACRKAQT